MSKVNILWMYDDLLDLYGDWGNLLACDQRAGCDGDLVGNRP